MTRRADRAEALRALGAEPVVGDALDREGLRAAVAAARPDVVMHQLTDLGAYDVDANARVRVAGTRNLVDAARAAGVRRIVAQSVAFCYAPGEGPADEATPLDVDAPESRRPSVRGVAALEAAVAEVPEWVVLRDAAVLALGWSRARGADNRRARALGWAPRHPWRDALAR